MAWFYNSFWKPYDNNYVVTLPDNCLLTRFIIMILFLLVLTSIIFMRYFYQIDITWMSIIPIATLVGMFFGTGLSSSHKSWIGWYIESHLQSFSRLLILTGVQIIFSLFQISWIESAIILIVINTFLLYITYLQNNTERQPTLKSGIIFQCLVYTLSAVYFAYLTGSFSILVSFMGSLVALLAGMWSFLYRIIGIFIDLDESSIVQYEVAFLYHMLLVFVILKMYGSGSEFEGLLIIQLYIALLFMGIGYTRSQERPAGTTTSDLDIQYILRWYTINELPSHTRSLEGWLSNPKLQHFIKHIPEQAYTALSINSIVITIIVCGLIVYFGSLGQLDFSNFWAFLVNTGLYLIIFYYCKKLGIQDKVRRVVGFIIINICFYIAAANVFAKDTVAILFWSIIRAVANNTTMNYLQDLKKYLSNTDYTYRLFSNFLGLIIILYFFMTLSIDILLKIAIVIMMAWLWMLMNKDNLKMIFQKPTVLEGQQY